MFKTYCAWLIAAVALCACQASVQTTPHSSPTTSIETQAPNIIILLADDLAYTDLSVYGGEIDTPNLTRIADQGLTFTRFLTSPMCSPSRAMLLTGNAAHRTGYGTMAEFASADQIGQPGYEGYLNDSVATIAEVLSEHGYQTHMAGKWHLGRESPPHDRGFQNSFALVEGAGSHFNNEGYSFTVPTVTYLDNGEETDLPEDFYSTDFYTSKILEYWEARDPSKPFFAYLPFTAPHWPLHAQPEDIEKYEGLYADGYEALRTARFEALKELGLTETGAVIPDSLSFVPAWDSLSAEQQELESRKMAVYAAMVDRIDQNIGRLLDRLRADGALENTIIIFSSDNGPEAIDFTTRPIFPDATDWVSQNYDNSLESLGSPGSYPFYGAPWAQAGASPHRYYKTYVTLGGSQVPFLISWPSELKQRGWVTETASMMDVAPTVYEAAEVAHPGDANDSLYAPDGRSMLGFLRGERADLPGSPNVPLELFGHESMTSGDWRILRLRPPEGNGEWALHNVRSDPGELIDLKEEEPERFNAMVSAYDAWTKEVGMVRVREEFEMFHDGAAGQPEE